MKVKRLVVSIFILLFLLLFPLVIAGGNIYVSDDFSSVFYSYNYEKAQFSAINYKEGYQTMVLVLDFETMLLGDKAVWIFPIPAEPSKIYVDNIKGFPLFYGNDFRNNYYENLYSIFLSTRLTQVYTSSSLILWAVQTPTLSSHMTSYKPTKINDLQGNESYKRIESGGLVTELISASNISSFREYIKSRGLNLPESSILVLEEYVGKEYSFVVSWIDDVEKFELEKRKKFRNIDYFGRNAIGILVRFPTKKIYYPLRLTSAYENKTIPIVINVLGYVKPVFYNEIKNFSDVDYYFKDEKTFPRKLEGFFLVYSNETSSDEKEEEILLKNIKSTEIFINAPSNYLIKDLWIEPSEPINIKLADFINRHLILSFLIILIFLSCLASLISAMITFKDVKISKIKFALFGLCNILTLFGFSIIAYLSRVDTRFTSLKENQKVSVPLWKVIMKSFIFSLLFFLLFSYYLIDLIFISFDMNFIFYFAIFVILLFFYIVPSILIIPFVWGYYNNRRIMKFTIIFSITFIILTIISQIILRLIV